MDGCRCESCINRCEVAPGWLIPGEIEKIATFLNLSLENLFLNFISIDYWVADRIFFDDIFVLSPSTIDVIPGNIFPTDNRYGKCIFLKEEKCLIHPVKPYECKMVYHDTSKADEYKLHIKVAEMWDNDENKKQIIQLLGKNKELKISKRYLLYDPLDF